MKVTVLGQTFDRGDFFALDLDGQGQTGHHSFPVNENGACPTRALVAALFRARQSYAFAQRVQQRDSWVSLNDVNETINLQLDVVFGHRNRYALGNSVEAPWAAGKLTPSPADRAAN
jgi:hypothetical protein